MLKEACAPQLRQWAEKLERGWEPQVLQILFHLDRRPCSCISTSQCPPCFLFLSQLWVSVLKQQMAEAHGIFQHPSALPRAAWNSKHGVCLHLGWSQLMFPGILVITFQAEQ